jgi:uncharacterized repeat protein (TIGR01451 family)
MFSRPDFGRDLFALFRRSLPLPQRASRRPRSGDLIEVLEGRIAPAAVLAATKSGDAAAHAFASAPIVTDPTVSLSLASSAVSEDGTANLVYTFTRAGYLGDALTVNFGVGGTATPNADFFAPLAKTFTATAGSITFTPGASTATLIIDPLNDPTVESNETVSLTLAAGTGYTIGTAGAFTGTILNDDGNTPLTFSQFVDPHPAAGNKFGSTVTPLSTGNVVITSPFDDAAGTDAGAVYLFNGTTGALISTLYGSHVSDQIGSKGVTALANGNFVVASPFWDSSAATDVGAATWGNGVTGLSGTIGLANSLVGSTAGDNVGQTVTALPNGNYVVSESSWHNGAALASAGAVTWGNGATGISGAISTANSLVGASDFEAIGNAGVRVLPSGNYLVVSTGWNNGDGAVTWVDGSVGLKGLISASNSLVGVPGHGDSVGNGVITVLPNGNYVVVDYGWRNGSTLQAGAVTWGSGTAGVSGVLSTGNSLVGSHSNDMVGYGGITALSNGNYVVASPFWHNGSLANAGAATWGNGTTGTIGTVDVNNSLVGGAADDNVGQAVVALANGNYVVSSPFWHNGALTFAGAVTWADGAGGTTGIVNAGNSLIGTQASDQVGSGQVVPLANGNYVVGSIVWHNTSGVSVGAATWANGATGLIGAVTAGNSLIGSTNLDQVGHVTALANGNYVAYSPLWNNGATADAGAITWGNGNTGVVGVIGASNSLVGSASGDQLGSGVVTPLSNGQFVVASPLWNNGVIGDAGAATWGSGTGALTGTINSSNSLVGSVANDKIGLDGVKSLPNGNYLVVSTNRANGATTAAGAVTWGNGATGITGPLSSSNSLLGSGTSDQVGSGGVTLLSNGNYVVSSPLWNSPTFLDAGASTWGNGATGTSGFVTTGNSGAGKLGNTGLAAPVVDEGLDRFYARWPMEGGGTVRVGAQATGFVPELKVQLLASTSVAEDGLGTLVYTFTRAGNSDSALTVNFNVGGTATFNNDYGVLGAASFTSSTGTVSFAPGVSTATVTVYPMADTVIESNETVILTPAGGTGYVVGSPTAATGTITNDDADIAVSLTTGTVSEDGLSNLVYTFTRTGFTGGALNVRFSLTGTASRASDFSVTGGTMFTPDVGMDFVTFAAGQTSLQLVVNPTNDNLVEADETVILNVTPGSYNIAAGGPLTGTITNDDSNVKVELLGTSSVAEDGAGNLVYTVTRTGFLANSLSVNLSLSGTAAVTGEYTNDLQGFFASNSSLGTGHVTFAPNQSTATVTIHPTADSEVEADESVILSVTASGGSTSGGYSIGVPGAATGTILNDDRYVGVAVGAASTAEDGAPLVYTFTRGGDPSAAMTVNFTVGGSAHLTGDVNFVSDYAQTGAATFSNTAGSVTFAAGSSTALVTLTPNDDMSVEGTESVTLTMVGGPGYSPSPTQTVASANLIDNDTASFGFVSASHSLGEGDGNDPLSFALTIDGHGTGTPKLERDVTFNTIATGGTAASGLDFVLPALLKFPSGSAHGATLNANLAINNDAIVEGIETATLGLSMAADGTGGQVSIMAGANSHAVTITDDDIAEIAFSTPSGTVTEFFGTDSGSLIMTITPGPGSSGTPALGKDVTVNLVTLAGGLATGGGVDYSLPSVTFSAGGPLSGPAKISVNDDRTVEGDEVANIGLVIAFDPTGGQVFLDAAQSTHATTILDNDTAMVRYLVSDSTVQEDAGSLGLDFRLDFSVTGTGPLSIERPMTFAVTATGGSATLGADFDFPLASMTYAAGSGNGATQHATLPITNDALVEGTETANLGLTVVSDGNGGHAHIATGGFEKHTVTITDNDTATIGFAHGTSSVNEGAGSDALDLVLTITADGAGTPALERSIVANLGATGGTATGADFTLPAAVTFGAGSLSGAVQTAHLDLVNDLLSEGAETVNLALTLGTDNTGGQASLDGAAATHTTTIVDNDIDLKLGVSGPDHSAVAGSGTGNLAYTATLTNQGLTEATNVDVLADFLADAGIAFTSATTQDGTLQGHDWVIPSIPVGGSATITFFLTADHTAAPNSHATTKLNIQSANETLVNTADDLGEATGAVIRQADLSVHLTEAPDPSSPLQPLTYTLKVHNAGPSDSTGASLLNVFPEGLVNITWTADFSANGGTGMTSGTGDINDVLGIPAGGEVVYTIHATPEFGAAGEHISNTATISSNEDPVSANNTTSVSSFINAIDLQLGSTPSVSTVGAGQLIKYTLSYRNGGYVAATGVHLDDLVPANTVFDLANSSAGWKDAQGHDLADGAAAGTAASYLVGALPVSDTLGTIVFAVRVKPIVPAGVETIPHHATIADDGFRGPDPVLSDNSVTGSTPLVAAPDLALTATVDKSLIIRGQTLHTTYRYSNTGTQDATGVVVEATVPLGAHFNAGESSPGWSLTGTGTYAFHLATLQAGAAPGSVLFAVDADTTLVSGVHALNGRATIADAGTNGLDPNAANNTALTASKLYEGIYAVSQGSIIAGKLGTPTVKVYDPVDGHELYHFDAYESSYRDLIRIAVADINGDGFDDIITTTGKGTGRLRVFDGLNGVWLHNEASYTGAFKNELAVFNGRTERGAYVAAGDLTGDGRADIVVGASAGTGMVRVFDGVTGLAQSFGKADTFFHPFSKAFIGGVRVSVGDVLGNGRADLVVSTSTAGAEVKVYDGQTIPNHPVPAGSPAVAPVAALDFKVGATTYRGGVSVALGDLDGDHKADLIVARNSGKPSVIESFSGLLKTGAGLPRAIGSTITPYDANPLQPTYTLGVRVAAIDIDFDGIADIITAPGGNQQSFVKIYSGANHATLLRTFTAFPETPTAALFVAATAVTPVVAR